MSDSGWLSLETDHEALRHNMRRFRAMTAPETRLLAVVKADGYGHGLLCSSRAFLEGGADMLGVHAIDEAVALRDGGIAAPVLVLGPVTRDGMVLAAQHGVDLTVGSLVAADLVASMADPAHPLRIHLKVETGVNRQGFVEAELDDALSLLVDTPGLDLVGVSSHFADLEDTTDRSWADQQTTRFEAWLKTLADRGLDGLARHMSCSAAAILMPSTHRDIVRVGISGYGVWPSRVTRVCASATQERDLELKPAVTWSCGISQIRDVPTGETVGYGRRWQAETDSRIAILPVGYSDGYPRRTSQPLHVLVRGRRAPVRGRVCMNLTMIDVTHIPEAVAGDAAVLLGAQGDERITAEQVAEWLGTIPYEILTLPGPTWRRTVKTTPARI